MKIRQVAHATVASYLKASKSEPRDEGPYELERCRRDSWWVVRNAAGFIVAQMTDAQVQRAIQ